MNVLWSTWPTWALCQSKSEEAGRLGRVYKYGLLKAVWLRVEMKLRGVKDGWLHGTGGRRYTVCTAPYCCLMWWHVVYQHVFISGVYCCWHICWWEKGRQLETGFGCILFLAHDEFSNKHRTWQKALKLNDKCTGLYEDLFFTEISSELNVIWRHL